MQQQKYTPEELREIVKQARGYSYKDEDITKLLTGQGYSSADITTALAPPPPPPGFLSGFAAEAGKQYSNFGSGLSNILRMGRTPGQPENPSSFGRTVEDLKFAGNVIAAIPRTIYQQMFKEPEGGPLDRVVNTGVALLGGDPQRMRERYAAGDTGGGLAAMAAVPVGLLGAGKLLGKVTKAVPPPNIKQISSGTRLIGRGVRAEFKPGTAAALSPFPILDADAGTTVSALVQPLVQQEAAEMGIGRGVSTKNLFTKASDYVGNVKRGGLDVLRVFSGAVRRSEAELNAAMEIFGPRKVPELQGRIVATLRSKAKAQKGVNDELYRAYNAVADKVAETGGTVEGLNTLKRTANKEMDSLFGLSEGKQIAATAHSVHAWQELANDIRAELYPWVKDNKGPDLTAYGIREAAAIQARNGVFDMYVREVAPEQAIREAGNYLNYLFGGSLYRSHVLRKAINPTSPMGQFNSLFNKYLGDTGEGMVPETVTKSAIPMPTNRLLPPGPNSPFLFSVPGDAPIESLSNFKVTSAADSAKSYLGPRQVPYLAHDPLSPQPPSPNATSWYRQRQDLGVTAETIPDRVRGIRSESKVRADQLGSSQTAIPNRSFTGPETSTGTNWQYYPSEADPLAPTLGPGVLITSDVKVAANTLAGIEEQLKKNIPPSTKAKLTSAYADLSEQIRKYYAYENAQPPMSVGMSVKPMKPGSVPAISVPKRFLATTTAADVAREEAKKKSEAKK